MSLLKNIEPKHLLVNRSLFTVKLGIAGIPISQMWMHVLAAKLFWNGGDKLPVGSGYDEICRRSTHDGKKHLSGGLLRNVVESLHHGKVREAVVAYDLGDVAELYGGHHRAVAAFVAGQSVPIVYRSLDPIARTTDTAGIMKAYDMVQRTENLASGRSYNPTPGRKPFRKSLDRLRMLYRAIIDVPETSLLDAGCNDGFFGVALSDHGFNPVFIDQSEAYCGVVRAKLKALRVSAVDVRCTSIAKASIKQFAVVLYTDVFYHAATKQSLSAALTDWRKLMKATTHKMIFCPGRWDKLATVGFTEKMMWDETRKAGLRIRYLGQDDDPGYRRPLFCLER